MTEQKVFVKNLEINYKIFEERQSVANKTLLILHGWESNSDRWQTVGQSLSENGFKVIIPDMPGFGKSETPRTPWDFKNYVSFVEEFAKNLNIENFYLLGHSFGGAIAVKVAVNIPQKLNKLFLVACSCIRKKTTLKKVLAKISKFVKFFSFLPYYHLARKAFYKFIIKKSDYVYTKGIMKETYLKAISEDLSCYLSFIKVPTIIIWGDKDESTPVEYAYFINKKIGNSKLIIIPGAGHNLNQKEPEILTREVLENMQ
ncbi:MAG: alpha/beta hydrolase [Candidatus Staskawiczbacteria bacterium]|nr:alpha/beta hydrolase [Candidatus Staskawiczbacteria bacterium]MBI3337473.1 alpha/beta hydrolase [Candidatus Staskawiczbacteria bacterium]